MPVIIGSSSGASSIVDYDSLQTAIGAWLHRDDLLNVIPDFIVFGENRIYRDLRVRQMESAFTGTISAGSMALPTSFLELKYAYIDGTPVQPLTKKDAEWVQYNYPTRSAQSKPKFIARLGENFIFGPYPDSGYTVAGAYYKRLPGLSASNTTNWLITEQQDLILFAALCESAPYLGEDERIPVWEAKYKQIVDRIRTNDANEEFSGSPLAMVAR